MTDRAPTEEKKCSQCGVVKPLDAYGQKRAHCRECGRKMDAVYRARKLSDPNKRARFYEQSKRSKARNRETWVEYDKKRDPMKRAAQARIRHLIADGLLQRGSCVICGLGKAEAHHEDYSKPQSIVWLCPQHHRDVHLGKLKVSEEHICHV